ncbi:Fc receptor-like protein 5 [Mixophyes fleayi]|uniref:Fc receptor-like protein 5 n=1 Tax=Mixophyes fleayi TaxID=3061075 RepID=UPI003F4E11BD
MPWLINFLMVILFGNSVMVYTEALSSPTIRLEPEQPVYFVGETVTLRCVAVAQLTATGYTFYKDGIVISDTYSSTSRLDIAQLTKSDSGNYFCTFFMEGANISLESNKIDLKVFDRPPSASVSVEPQRNVFIKEQSVVLRCQLPIGQSASEVTLYQNGRPIYESDNFGILTLAKVETKHTGNYTCGYKIINSGRSVESYPSKEEPLVVIDQPSTPNLKFTYGFHSQSGQVELVCEVQYSSFSPINGYRFYRNGRELARQQVNYSLMNYSLEFDGCYYCQTFVKILGQEIVSPKSSEHFLAREEGNRDRVCQEQNVPNRYDLSTQGIKLYGSILAGKLLVLICLLIIFGIHHLITRRQTSVIETQRFSR